MLRALAILASAISVNAFYTVVPTGHCGITVTWGIIGNDCLEGGVWYNPLTTSVRFVKYIPDTDIIYKVPCLGIDGTPMEAPSIEVENKISKDNVVAIVKEFGFDYDQLLLMKRIPSIWRELCAVRTVDQMEITDYAEMDNAVVTVLQKELNDIGVKIIINLVRITNVNVPDQIRQRRAEIRNEKEAKRLAEEKKDRIRIEKETELSNQNADNIKQLSVVKAAEEQETIRTRERTSRNEIEARSAAEVSRTNANAAAEATTIASKANADKMAREAVELEKFYKITGYAEVLKVQALQGNTKIYFGESLPEHMYMTPNGMPLPAPIAN